MLRKGWTATSLECTLCGRKLPPAMPSRPSTAALRRLEDAGSVCSLSRLGRTGHSDIDTEVIALCRSLARLAEGPPDTGRSFCGNSSNNRPAFSPPPATGKIVGVPSGCVNAHTLHRGLKAYSPAELRVRIQAGRPRSATSRRENTTHPDEGVTEYTRADAMMAMKALDRLVSFIALELSRKAVLEKKVGEVEEEVKRWEEKALDAEENLDSAVTMLKTPVTRPSSAPQSYSLILFSLPTFVPASLPTPQVSSRSFFTEFLHGGNELSPLYEVSSR
eukprot:Hpha_TRINITY_DN14165_c0_g1::TRINITY_DN14165_c0_g1_i3::g.11180::m.11180